jgi:hypothetical protein
MAGVAVKSILGFALARILRLIAEKRRVEARNRWLEVRG